MSSQLPENLEQITISAMRNGEVGFTYAWAVYVEKDGTSWIRGDYPLFWETTDNASLRIERDYDRMIVYKDTVGDYKYDRREKPMDEWEPIIVEWT